MISVPSRELWTPHKRRSVRGTPGLECAPPMAFAMAHAVMGSQVPGSFEPPDLPGLVLWLRADLGITYVQGPVVATGTTPPTVTLSGTPSSATNTIEIDITGIGILGVALFSWKWNGVVQQTAQVTAASFPLAGTGITASFGAGTYALNDVYTSVVTVSAWADQSGAGNNITQATATAQPSFSPAGGPNGLPALTFDGVAQFLLASFAQTEPWEVFVVAKYAAAGSTGTLFDGGHVNQCRCYRSATSTLNMYGGGNLVFTATSTNWNVLDLVYTSGAMTARANGVQKNTGSSGTNPQGFCLGAYNGGDYAACSVAEAIAYNATLANAVNPVERYLGARYGISVA